MTCSPQNGDCYLVDLQRLIPVSAVSPLDAAELARLAIGDADNIPPLQCAPNIYRREGEEWVLVQ